MPDRSSNAEKRTQWYTDHGLTYSATFIPLSKSRNANEKHRTINWRIAVGFKGQRGSLVTDYSAGIGHIPGRPQGAFLSIDQDEADRQTCETGKVSLVGRMFSSNPVPDPTRDDVMCSLLLDGEADNASFADWCTDFGYDTDSRKAEQLYYVCRDIGQKLRSMFGAIAIEELRALFTDY